MSERAARPHSPLRERVAPALGLGSAALIAGAALVPFGDPTGAARAEFASSAARLSDAVAAQYERLLADEHAFEVAWRWEEGELERARSLPPEPAPVSSLGRTSATAVLAREAARLEAAGDAEGALTTAEEALGAGGEPCERGAARLVALRAARALDRGDVARAHWTSMSEELSGDEVAAGAPLLAIGALAIAPELELAGRQAAQALLVERWCGGRLALDDEGRTLAFEGDAQAPADAWRAPTPRRDVLRERVGALAPGGAAAERLWSCEQRRALAALADAVDMPLARPSDARWQVVVWRGLLLAWRAEGPRSVVAALERPADIARSVAVRLEQDGELPNGFALDFRGDGEGEVVRPERELAGAALAFTLRHADPERAVRGRALRLQALRLALLATAVAVAGASLATQRALSRARRLAAREREFVANVSHELRTPVAAILMLSENLEQGRVDGDGAHARYFALIRREAERLRRLVGDLLDASRLERGKALELALEEVELPEFAERLGEELGAWSARTGFGIELELARLAGRARLDTDALSRALVNLAENARRHSGADRARVEGTVAGEALVLAVEDRGRGVPAAERERIFERFARVERPGAATGTGLGLAIVREIAAGHGGSVVLREPAGGVGARFELRLPLAGPPENPEVTP
jgi:signal transduction histidine kinase